MEGRGGAGTHIDVSIVAVDPASDAESLTEPASEALDGSGWLVRPGGGGGGMMAESLSLLYVALADAGGAAAGLSAGGGVLDAVPL